MPQARGRRLGGVLCVVILAIVFRRREDSVVIKIKQAASGGWPSDDDSVLKALSRGIKGPNLCDIPVYTSWPSVIGKEAFLVRNLTRYEMSLADLKKRKTDTQSGAGSDIVQAGGGITNYARLKDVVNLALTPDEETFTFDTRQERPKRPKALNMKFDDSAYPVFSLGPSRSGLPSHAHGETWLAIAHGVKRWFLAPATASLKEDHPLMSPYTAFRDGFYKEALSCLQFPGDLIYLPRAFKHATLNLGACLAVGEQMPYAADLRYSDALQTLRLHPYDLQALHSAGVAAFHLNRFDKAAFYLEKAARLYPLHPEIHVLWAEVLVHSGLNNKAYEAIYTCQETYRTQNHSAISPKALAAAHIKFARFFLGVSEFERAIHALNTALNIRPEYPSALKDRAFAFSQIPHLKERALADLKTARALDPTDPQIPAMLKMYFSEGRSSSS